MNSKENDTTEWPDALEKSGAGACQIERLVMHESVVMVRVPVHVFKRCYFVAESSRDNARELFGDYTERSGAGTKKNRHMLNIYRKEEQDAEELMATLVALNNCEPFGAQRFK